MALTPSTSVTTYKGALDGFFKTVYGKKLQDLIPTWGIFQKDIKFSQADTPGKDWKMPVVLQAEQGVSYLGASHSLTILNNSAPGATAELTVDGYQHVIRSTLDYKSAFSAAKSEQAFKRTTGHIVESMWMSHRKRVEIDTIYGRSPMGIVSSVSGSTITFTAASWAPGLWAGMKGANVFGIEPNGVTTSMAATAIVSVSLTSNSIVVAAPTTVTAGDYIYYDGQITAGPTWNCMKGIDSIVTHASTTTTDTTLFGTHNYRRELLTGVSVDAGSVDLSFGTLQDAMQEVIARGADSDYTVYISPRTWANLMNDQAALRRYDASYKESKLTLGAKTIEFYGPIGTMSIKAHPMIKEGEAFGLPVGDAWKRIGTTDITFSRPDLDGKSNGNNFFLELQDYAVFELRSYDDQQVFTYCPAKSFKVTGIVNTI